MLYFFAYGRLSYCTEHERSGIAILSVLKVVCRWEPQAAFVLQEFSDVTSTGEREALSIFLSILVCVYMSLSVFEFEWEFYAQAYNLFSPVMMITL